MACESAPEVYFVFYSPNAFLTSATVIMTVIRSIGEGAGTAFQIKRVAALETYWTTIARTPAILAAWTFHSIASRISPVPIPFNLSTAFWFEAGAAVSG